jgi:predicted metal-binding membrane protein
MVSERASQRAFFGVSALLFAAASAAMTIVSSARPCRRWARDADARGQMRTGAAASLLSMWVVVVMMVAMMMLLPSLVPMLWRYRQAVRQDRQKSGGFDWILR